MPTEKWKRENADKMRQYRREWYYSNREHAKSKIKERKIKLRKWLNDYKSQLCCKCGQDHLATIQFHHLDPKLKDIELAKVVRNGWSIERILNEMTKCMVLCANCYLILHFNERNCAGLV